MHSFIFTVKTKDNRDYISGLFVFHDLDSLFAAINEIDFWFDDEVFKDEFTVICLDDGIHYPFTTEPSRLFSLYEILKEKYGRKI